MAATRPPARPTQPQVRARYMQTFMAHVDQLPAEDRQAIRDAVPGASWAAIDSAGPLEWLSMEVNLTCTRAVADQLGPERTHVFFRALLMGATESPLLRGFVQAVLRVTVRDPGLYLPWISRGFELLFRDAGRWSVTERAAGAAVMEVRGLPVECFEDGRWLQSVASSLHALLDLIQHEGSVTVDRVDPANGRVAFRSRWHVR